MDTAHHIPTDATIHALATWHRITAHPEEREHYRARAGTLRCVTCGEGAWFISGNIAGRAPAFSAHHALGCEQAGVQHTQEPGALEAAAALINDATRITLRNTPLGQAAGGHIRADGDPDPQRHHRVGQAHDAGEGVHQVHNRHLELRGILANLINDPQYIQGLGQARIDLPDRPNVLPEHAFWAMKDFDPDDQDHMGKQLLVWGKVGTVNLKHGYCFINQAPPPNNRGTIRLDADQVPNVIAQYAHRGVSESWHFKGGWVIAVGRPQTNQAGTVTVPTDPAHLAFCPPPQAARP